MDSKTNSRQETHVIPYEQWLEYEHFYKGAPIGLCLLDCRLRYLRVNEHLAAVNGHPAAHHIGRSIREIVPDLAPQLVPLYERAIDTGASITNILVCGKVPAGNGGESCLLASLYPLKADDGSVIAVSTIVQDITESKNAEAKVVRAESDWEQTFDAMTDFVALLDTECRIIRVNRAMAQHLDREPEELVGQFFYKAFHNSDIAPAHCQHARVLADGLAHTCAGYEDCLGENTYLTTISPLLDTKGEVTGCVHVARDITERKQIEEALKDSESRLRTAIDSLPFDIFVLDRTGHYIMQNAAIKNRWGELIGKRPRDFAPDETTLALWQSNNRRALAGETVRGEVSFTGKEGLGYYYNILTPMYIDGEIDAVMGINIDITERKKAELALAELNRFDEIIADLSALFINMPPKRVDVEIEQGLQSLTEILGMDRGTLMQFSEDKRELYITHSFAVPEFEPLPKMEIGSRLPWYRDRLLEGRALLSETTDDITDGASAEKQFLLSQGIKSSMSVPLKVGGDVLGTLGMVSFRTEKEWPEQLVRRTRLVGEIFTNALVRKQADKELVDRYRYETLLAELSTRFVSIPAGKADEAIESGLKILGEYLGIDAVTVLQFSEDMSELTRTHMFRKGEYDPLPKVNLKEVLPYLFEKVSEGEIVFVGKIEDIPAEGVRELAAFKERGVKSLAGIPLVVAGKVLGCIGLVTMEESMVFAGPVLKRFRIVGEIFANALARLRSEESLRKAFSEIENLKEKLEAECFYLREELKLEHNFGEIIGQSNALRDVLFRIGRVAHTDTTVLITGETGTGKELVARAVHTASSRKDRPLVKLNCAALPADLIESELFGHERGAFTGAYSRQVGRFEIANGATIFLDEIGELPLGLQSKLLRVLQDGEFERIGNPRPMKVDVRVVAATNRDLEMEVRSGRFREDLWYRLNVYPIRVPPLRERKEDIPLLVQYFANKHSKRMGRSILTIPQGVMDVLGDYSWPGNVRELENVIERAVISSPDTVLRLAEKLEAPVTEDRFLLTLEEVEKAHIVQVLERTEWRVEGSRGAARILGLHPSTLRGRMRKFGIERP